MTTDIREVMRRVINQWTIDALGVKCGACSAASDDLIAALKANGLCVVEKQLVEHALCCDYHDEFKHKCKQCAKLYAALDGKKGTDADGK